MAIRQLGTAPTRVEDAVTKEYVDSRTGPVSPVGLVSEDLDSLQQSGVYHQNVASRATVATSYPEEGLAGLLEVIATPSKAYQRFTGVNGRVYVREADLGAWLPWSELVTRADLDELPKRGILQYATGPAVTTDFTGLAIVLQFGRTYYAGRMYRITAYGEGLQITSSGTATLRLAGSVGVPISMLYRAHALPVNVYANGTVVSMFEPPSSGAYTIQVTAQSTAGAHRVNANAVQLSVEDVTYE